MGQNTKAVPAAYTIGKVAELLGEHPETIRVWERNGLIQPDRSGYQRKYSEEDIMRLKFIKHLMAEGMNIPGIKVLIRMYPCWHVQGCSGGAKRRSRVPVNESKPCWKEEGTYCLLLMDMTDACGACQVRETCKGCATQSVSRITRDMTLLEIAEKYPEVETIIRSYDEIAGVCLWCEHLFDSLETISNQFGIDLEELLARLNDDKNF